MVEQVKKYFNENGDVGVLVSGGYGAGWSTWDNSGRNTEQILFEPTVIQMMLDDADPKDVEAYCESKYEHGYFGGVDGLHIVWLKPGTEFYIDEYDGAEGLIQKERHNWNTA